MELSKSEKRVLSNAQSWSDKKSLYLIVCMGIATVGSFGTLVDSAMSSSRLAEVGRPLIIFGLFTMVLQQFNFQRSAMSLIRKLTLEKKDK